MRGQNVLLAAQNEPSDNKRKMANLERFSQRRNNVMAWHKWDPSASVTNINEWTKLMASRHQKLITKRSFSSIAANVTSDSGKRHDKKNSAAAKFSKSEKLKCHETFQSTTHTPANITSNVTRTTYKNAVNHCSGVISLQLQIACSVAC